jgi:hypothetical protein
MKNIGLLVAASILLFGCHTNIGPVGFQKRLYFKPLSGQSITNIRGSVALSLASDNFTETLFTVATTPITDCKTYRNGEEFDTYEQLFAAHPNLQPVQCIILKQPVPGLDSLDVNYDYPGGVSNQGCLVYIVDTGPPNGVSLETNYVELTVTTDNSPAQLTVGVDGGSEFCFGQSFGCQLHTLDNATTFVHAAVVPADSTLVALTGDIGTSALVGAGGYGAPPMGAWSMNTDWYFIPGGCKEYPIGDSVLQFPIDTRASPVYSVEQNLYGVDTMQTTLNQPINLDLKSGDCLLTVVYMKGAGAIDTENQVRYVLRQD